MAMDPIPVSRRAAASSARKSRIPIPIPVPLVLLTSSGGAHRHARDLSVLPAGLSKEKMDAPPLSLKGH